MSIELEHMTSHMLLTHITSERNHQGSSRPCATLTLMSTPINEHASHMQLNGLISELNRQNFTNTVSSN